MSRRTRENNNYGYEQNKRQRTQQSQELFYDFDVRPDHIFVNPANPQSLTAHLNNKKIAVVHPEVEVLRAKRIRATKERYIDIVPQKLGILSPKLSFNRWLNERKLLDKQEASDPVLPGLLPSESNISPLLFREIADDLPVKAKLFPRSTTEALQNLKEYMNEITKLMEKQVASSADLTEEDKQVIKTSLEKAQTVYSSEKEASKLAECVKELKTTCNPILTKKMRPIIEQICLEMSEFSDSQSKQLKEETAKANKEKHDYVRVYSHAKIRGVQILEYGRQQVSINSMHLSKLRKLFSLRNSKKSETKPSSSSEGDVESFSFTSTSLSAEKNMEEECNNAIFSLLLRYDTIFGERDGGGLNAALPEQAFKVLSKEFDVEQECFASPMNCFYAQFCSAYPDVDSPFGSVCSFFDFEPVEGSFEANPPFVDDLMIAMAHRIDKLLGQTQKPLSFIVIVPNWTDSESLLHMGRSKFLRHDVVLGAEQHQYVTGSQHITAPSKRKFNAVHETHIYFLQNDAGFAKWQPTSEKVLKFTAATRQAP